MKEYVDLVPAEIFIPYSVHTRDLVRVAALFHDMVKNGYDNSRYTAFNHPILASNLMRKIWRVTLQTRK